MLVPLLLASVGPGAAGRTKATVGRLEDPTPTGGVVPKEDGPPSNTDAMFSLKQCEYLLIIGVEG